MSSDSAFAELLARLRNGDQEAASRIFHAYSRRLIALARGRLHGLIRQKTDPEDVMGSVFKSFFRRDAEQPFELDSWDSLLALLTVIALRKCGHHTRYFRAACRDVLREAAGPAGEESQASWEAIAREPTPDEAAELTDTVERLMRGLDERGRAILSLSLQGYSVPEVAEQVGRSERTVFRTLERVRQGLEARRAQDGPAA